MERELGPVLSAALFIIEEIDRSKLPNNVLTEVNEVEAQIVKSLPIISSQSNASHLRKVSSAQTAHRGPVFAKEGGSQIPSAPCSSDLPPGPAPAGTTATTSSSPGTYQSTEKRGRRPKKGGYICNICGKKRDRKSDLDGHMWTAHRVGEPIQCNIAPCSNRDFSNKSALRSHIKTQHTKKHAHNCPDCDFGCESVDYYKEHRIRKHNMRIVMKKTGETRIYYCKKCGKVFPGPASLSRHRQRGLCNKQKVIDCTDCIKSFKTKKGMEKHFQQFHTPGAQVWECQRPKCTVQLNSLNAFQNHQRWHNGMNSKVRRQIARERRKEQARLRAFAKGFEKKKPKSPRSGDPDYSAPTAKSTPAKVLPPRRSPRGHKGAKK